MKKLLGSLLLAGVLLGTTPSCATMKAAGEWVCARKEKLEEGITTLGDKGAILLGPVAPGIAWLLNFGLDSICSLMEFPGFVMQDVGDTVKSVNPFGGDEEPAKDK